MFFALMSKILSYAFTKSSTKFYDAVLMILIIKLSSSGSFQWLQ